MAEKRKGLKLPHTPPLSSYKANSKARQLKAS
jgi:hypothetical protein